MLRCAFKSFVFTQVPCTVYHIMYHVPCTISCTMYSVQCHRVAVLRRAFDSFVFAPIRADTGALCLDNGRPVLQCLPQKNLTKFYTKHTRWYINQHRHRCWLSMWVNNKCSYSISYTYNWPYIDRPSLQCLEQKSLTVSSRYDSLSIKYVAWEQSILFSFTLNCTFCILSCR